MEHLRMCLSVQLADWGHELGPFASRSRSCLSYCSRKLVSADLAIPFPGGGTWSHGFQVSQLSKVSMVAQSHSW